MTVSYECKLNFFYFLFAYNIYCMYICSRQKGKGSPKHTLKIKYHEKIYRLP